MDQRAAAIFYWLVRKMIDTLERTFGKLQGSAKRVGKLSWKKPADWDGGYCRVYLCHQGIPLTKSNVHGVQQCLGQWYMSNSTWWPRPKVSQLNLCPGRDTISAGFPFFSYCILLLFFFQGNDTPTCGFPHDIKKCVLIHGSVLLLTWPL